MQYFLFVNFKTYEEGSGKKALSLAKLLAGFNSGEVDIIPVVQVVDLRQIVYDTPLKIFVQHVDPISYGANTGMILPEAVRDAGAFGCVVNHAENKRDNIFVEAVVRRCHEVNLKVLVCAESLERAKQIAFFSPDFIAVEPPELIGGNVSVSTAKPELISDAVKAINGIDSKIKVLVGAGIKTNKDVSKAIELGSCGVFVSSGIVCAKDKEYALRSLLSGFPSKNSSELLP
ncbi:MAG: triose-phosphate isomerase, partial [Candidatus Diapherotrites archaeon]